MSDSAVVRRRIDELKGGSLPVRQQRPRRLVFVGNLIYQRGIGFIHRLGHQANGFSAVGQTASELAGNRNRSPVSGGKDERIARNDCVSFGFDHKAVVKAKIDAPQRIIRQIEGMRFGSVVYFDKSGSRDRRIVHQLVNRQIIRRVLALAAKRHSNRVLAALHFVSPQIKTLQAERVDAVLQRNLHSPALRRSPLDWIFHAVDLDCFDRHRSRAGQDGQIVPAGKFVP